ncbi:2897_t:CDS:2 [Ambispora gerdemannii]|uniref:Exosome complex component RRP45 n=1 Tax=Ambispora gerdemannii TaxID=144530 RepID=A0A9N8VLX2_9GLOM|nr:2897_t:CDS:2 [Ambispora gerdemannii]
MVKELEASNNEKSFILEALREGIRLDYREKHDFRPLRFFFGPNYGHVEVHLGATKILVKVSCEVTHPYPDRASEGILILNTEISPMAIPSLDIGRPSEDEVLVSRILERAIKRSRAIDTEGLCIVAGEKVWTIRVDIHFLEHDGNIIDAACIAALTALSHFRRPEVTLVGTDVTIHPVEQRNPVPLSVHHMPICVTFAFFDNGEILVVDPSLQEEQIREGDMTITLNDHREICALSKAGGIELNMDKIVLCSKIATARVTEIHDQIKKALEKDSESR